MKKTALFALSILLSLSFYSAQAQGQKPKPKKELESSQKFSKTGKEDSLQGMLEFYFKQFNEQKKTLSETQQFLAQANNELTSLKNTSATKQGEVNRLSTLNTLLEDENDSLAEIVATMPKVKGSGKKEIPAIGLPLIDFSKCPSDSVCDENLLDFLLGIPDQDFTEGNTETLKKIRKANEVFSRLDPWTTANYLTTLNDQMDFLSKKDYQGKRAVYAYIVRHLEDRKSDILSDYETYSKYGGKKKVERMFSPTVMLDRYFGQKAKRHSTK